MRSRNAWKVADRPARPKGAEERIADGSEAPGRLHGGRQGRLGRDRLARQHRRQVQLVPLVELAQPLDRGPDVGQESLDRSLDRRVGGVVGEAPEQVEPALGHPARDVRLAQPSLLDLPRATAQAGPVVDAARVGIGRAEPVLVGVVVAVGLDEGDQRRVERRESSA